VNVAEIGYVSDLAAGGLTMATAVQNALKRKKELLRELAEIDSFLAMHERFSTWAVVTLPEEGALEAGFPSLKAQSGDLRVQSSNVGGKRRGRPAEFVVLMQQILKDTGQPMQRAQLVSAVEKMGIIIPSDDKERYLGTILWRNRDKFVNIPGAGYRLTDDMLPDEVDEAHQMSDLLQLDDDVKDRALDEAEERNSAIVQQMARDRR
jgi:hypothetical protein